MRHRSGQRKLNITDGAHRIAMMRNISNSLIRHERIRTTLVRAKELRRFVEPLITLSKEPSVANRRLAFSRLQDRDSVVKLFDDIGERVAERPGGYIRILKHGFRAGDNAPMALVEFVDQRDPMDEVESFEKAPARKKAKKAKKAAPTSEVESAEADESAEASDADDAESQEEQMAESAAGSDNAPEAQPEAESAQEASEAQSAGDASGEEGAAADAAADAPQAAPEGAAEAYDSAKKT